VILYRKYTGRCDNDCNACLGEIDEHEFIAWMEDNVSRLKMALVVTRIMMGLGQVMLKQPEALKEEFPGPQVGFHALVRKTSSLPRS
jgi:hypothetical protein